MKIFNMSRLLETVTIVLLFFVFECYAETAVNSTDSNNEVKLLPAVSVPAGSDKTVSSNAESEAITNIDVMADAMELRAEQWDIARSGKSLLTLPVLNKLVTAWLDDRHMMIEIQYPGGEEGEFWVQELTDWLVSLGIPSKHMITAPGSGSDDMIRFQLIK